MKRLIALATLIFTSSLSAEEPAAPDKESPPTLKPGEFQWHPERSESGPILMIVSRDDQVIYIYRNGIEIARSTVSTGMKGHTTPTGVFQILQKNKDHVSSIYKGAKMPFMQRLTWQGIALHAGDLPGYPASHGCIRLPFDFSKLLFGITSMGATVVVTSEHSAPENSLKPYEVIKEGGKNLVKEDRIKLADKSYVVSWHPEKQKEGHLSIVVSGGSRIVHVLRNGVEIGRAEFSLQDENTPLPTGLFVMLDRKAEKESPVVKGETRNAWAMVALDKNSQTGDLWTIGEQIQLPQSFAKAVYDELEPGTLLVFTPEKLDPEKRSATDFVVADAEGGVQEKE